MKRPYVSIVAVLIALFATVAWGAGGNGGSKVRPRFTPPKEGHPGKIDIEQYFRIEDPREAARLMLSEAGLAQVNVDQQWGADPMPEIELQSGPMKVDKNDRSFFENAPLAPTAPVENVSLICLLRFSRAPTIRELSQVLDAGIRIYRGVPHYAYIARVPNAAKGFLSEFAPLEWVGDYRAEYKYDPSYRFSPNRRLMIYSLVGDCEECRQDLERLGAVVKGFYEMNYVIYHYEYYDAQAGPDLIPQLAALWWVQKIDQFEATVEFGVTADDTSGSAFSAGSVSFKANDSRRLVSWSSTAHFGGFSQSPLIFESGCDWWNHSDLRVNALPVPSDASSDSLHGTMVAGVAVGARNTNVSGGGVCGVAPRAKFVFRRREMQANNVSVLGPDADSGYWIQNHSWGALSSGGQYTNVALQLDGFADDRGALMIVAAGGSQIPGGISSPATGKNVVAVGAVDYVEDEIAGTVIGKLTDYSPVSSQSYDFLKPDLVAPGGSGFACEERGVVSCASTSESGCDMWDYGYKYTRSHGTSFAAPHVTGAAAIIAEWYQNWVQENHYGDASFDLTSELMRTFLINSAIPLEWNGDYEGRFGAIPGDTVATDETLRGFANLKYGFGLVNCHSGIESRDDELRRVLIWQDDVVGALTTQVKEFALRPTDFWGEQLRPRYLVATMAYSDLPGTLWNDQLEFTLESPSGAVFSFHPPAGILAGTVQKMIIPSPERTSGVNWKAKVKFAHAYPLGPGEQHFAVVVDAMLDDPNLALGNLKDEYWIKAGSTLNLPVSVTNVGKNVAAGVTLRVVDSAFILVANGETNQSFYVGNLNGGEKGSHAFKLQTAFASNFQIVVEANAINKMMDGGPYPLRKTITIHANEMRVVYGVVKMLPGWNQTVQYADIFVNGVKSAQQTSANGSYSVEVEKHFTGTIKPRKGTVAFTPAEISYATSPVDDDKPAQDYQADYRMVQGRIVDQDGQGVSGIVVTPRPGSGNLMHANGGVTASNGGFTCYVEHGWFGRFEPQATASYVSFSFDHSTQAYFDSVAVNVGDLNFTTRRVALWGAGGTQVSTDAHGDYTPECVSDGAGGVIVTWTDQGSRVRAQRIASSGSPMWGAAGKQMSTTTAEQVKPHVVRLSDGTSIVVWKDKRNSNWDIYAQRLGVDGQPLWTQNGIPVCQVAGDQQNIRLGVAPAGFAVVVWEDRRSGSGDIFAQRIEASGTLAWTAGGVSVCDAAGDQASPLLAIDSQGAAYVLWKDKRGGPETHTYLQHLLPAGVPGSGWTEDGVRVGSLTNLDETSQSLAVGGDDACLITVGHDEALAIKESYVIKVTSAGTTLWTTVATRADWDAAFPPQIGTDGTGGMIVAGVRRYQKWCTNRWEWIPKLYVERFDSGGNRVWIKDDVAPNKWPDQPALLSIPGGGAIVCWRESPYNCGSSPDPDVRGQRFDSNGCPMWGKGFGVAVAPEMQQYPFLTYDLVSGAFVCWYDNRGLTGGVYASHVNDNPLTFSVSGHVRDSSGAGVSNVEVTVEDDDGTLVSGTTSGDGAYVLGVPAFWTGHIIVHPRGELNSAAPEEYSAGPVLSHIQRDFQIRHSSTSWKREGLQVASNPDLQARNSVAHDGADALLLAWTGQDNGGICIQRLDSSGDIRWTSNGDRFAPEVTSRNPCIVASTGSSGILFWERDAIVGSYGAGIAAQRIDAAMHPQWSDGGALVVAGDDVPIYSACSDDAGGAFVCWYDGSSGHLNVQRLGTAGALVWAQPTYIGLFGASSTAPIMEPDGGGGVLICWQMPYSLSSYIYVQRLTPQGTPLWGGPGTSVPFTARGNGYINEGDFGMVGDGRGGAYVAWSERSQLNSLDERVRVSWVWHTGTRLSGNAGTEFTSTPGRMFLDDMALMTSGDGNLLVLYDEWSGGGTRLVLQNVDPDLWGGAGIGWGWPAQGATIVGTSPRYVGEARVLGGGNGSLVFWGEASGDIFAQRIDSVGVCPWITRQYSVAENAYLTSVASDGRGGAYVVWDGGDGGLYATRMNDSLVVRGDVTVTSYVRRYGTGIVEPANTARAVGCPKGEMDNVVFSVELGGQVMTPIPPEQISLSWPSTTQVLPFRAAVADSAMRLDGDRYRTTITLRELGGCGDDSVTVQAFGWPVAKARFDVISPDIETHYLPGTVSASDLAAFLQYYPTSQYPNHPYSACADYDPVARPNFHITSGDFASFVTHYGHKKPAGLAPEYETGTGTSTGDVVLHFREDNSTGRRLLKVSVGLSGVEPFTVAFLALRNENPSLQFADWHQSSTYPYMAIAASTIRDGESQVAIGAVNGKHPSAWNGELGTIDLLVSSSAPLELTEDDFALVTGDILAASGTVHSVSMRSRDLPPKFGNSLSQNYPNPFNPTTTIKYSIAAAGHVDLTIFDVHGAVVKRLVNGERRPNTYKIVWDGRNNSGNMVASGVYFYRLRAPKFTATKKMLLLK